MIAACILSASVLLGAAGWGEAAPQYSSFHHHQSQLNVHPHHQQHQLHHHEHHKKEIYIDNSDSHSDKLEDPEAKRSVLLIFTICFRTEFNYYNFMFFSFIPAGLKLDCCSSHKTQLDSVER